MNFHWQFYPAQWSWHQVDLSIFWFFLTPNFPSTHPVINRFVTPKSIKCNESATMTCLTMSKFCKSKRKMLTRWWSPYCRAWTFHLFAKVNYISEMPLSCASFYLLQYILSILLGNWSWLHLKRNNIQCDNCKTYEVLSYVTFYKSASGRICNNGS